MRPSLKIITPAVHIGRTLQVYYINAAKKRFTAPGSMNMPLRAGGGM